jgi:type II restriction enzyme
MNLNLTSVLTDLYSSNSQKIRVISEYWVKHSIFCPNCGNSLTSFENNKPVADFYCKNCSEEYELKSKNGILGKKIVDGAYNTMIERLNSNNNPNFFFLTYNKETLKIHNFITVPKYFFTEEIIEKRKPLSETAKRAGWIGCNIIINNIPDFGKIFYIKNGELQNKDIILEHWHKTSFIKNTTNIETKGWLFDTLKCIEKINKNEFYLNELYAYEYFLKKRHPLNNNIQAKLRQQLQILRDKDIIEFIGKGKYLLKKCSK